MEYVRETHAIQRLRREIKDVHIISKKIPTFRDFLTYIPETIDSYEVFFGIKGPKRTPYENCKFQLTFTYTIDYPFSAPCIFISPIPPHPNINLVTGEILFKKDKWCPATILSHLLLLIESLFYVPIHRTHTNSNTSASTSTGTNINKIKEVADILEFEKAHRYKKGFLLSELMKCFERTPFTLTKNMILDFRSQNIENDKSIEEDIECRLKNYLLQ